MQASYLNLTYQVLPSRAGIRIGFGHLKIVRNIKKIFLSLKTKMARSLDFQPVAKMEIRNSNMTESYMPFTC